MWHQSLYERWATVIRSAVRYELTHLSRLNNTDSMRSLVCHGQRVKQSVNGCH